ncbi:MAG: helix-turn-helix domain-containing protein [Acidobacteria bacterium]|nr:helix-turn-helix domain-containing protein [Acidobacteriota bacterium]
MFRLRLHRERKGIRLEDISAATRMKRERLEALERNDLLHWPRGLYARACVHAYASLVGLDPIDTVDEFCRLFPHGDRRAGPMLREIAAIVAHPTEYRDEFREADRRRGAPYLESLPAFPWRFAVARAARALWRAGRARPAVQPSGPYSARRATL